MKVLFIPRVLNDATAYYRCVLPARALDRVGAQSRVEPLFETGGPRIKAESAAWADVIVFQRPLSEMDVEMAEMVRERHPEKVLVGEYDDDYGSVPGWNPGYRFVRPCKDEWVKIPSLFDGITVSTDPLRGVLERHTNRPVKVIRNAFDFEAIDAAPLRNDVAVQRLKAGDVENFPVEVSESLFDFSSRMKAEGKHVVTWFGSHTHYIDLDWIVEDVKSLYEVHNRNDIVFVFFGYVLWKLLAEIPVGNCYFIPGQPPRPGSGVHGVEEFYGVLKALPASVGLAPVHPCVFNDSKSSLKVEECKAFGFLPVASRYDTYMNDIDEGLLADYRFGDWAAKIQEAVDSSGRSARVLRNRELVRQKHDVFSRGEMYRSFFEALQEEKRAG
ncbi:MAG: hypothetical protein ACRCXD_00090 [Luteolibacter sp.]